MEPSYKTRKIIGRLVVLLALLLLGAGFWAHYTSPLAQPLTSRSQDPIRLIVFTKPAMLLTYTPATRKARITLASKKCSVENQSACFNQSYQVYFTPTDTDQHAFWTQFATGLEHWRFTPKTVWTYVRAYINALVQKRTNLRPGDFLLLSKELIELTRTDFAVEYPDTSKKKKATKEKIDPVVQERPEVSLPYANSEEKPLVLEVLNASGQKGLALTVTQYLREQNTKGLLRVDVINYDNYPSLQDTSFITDYSGRLVQVTQVSHALGLSKEIRSEKSTTAICDTRIVLGKDFKMPL